MRLTCANATGPPSSGSPPTRLAQPGRISVELTSRASIWPPADDTLAEVADATEQAFSGSCMHEDTVVGFLAPPACPSTHETSTNPRKLNELRTLSVHNDRRDHRLTQRLSVSCRQRRGRRRRAAFLPKALLPITDTTVAILRTRSDAGHRQIAARIRDHPRSPATTSASGKMTICLSSQPSE
jgi:hypothetical protein